MPEDVEEDAGKEGESTKESLAEARTDVIRHEAHLARELVDLRHLDDELTRSLAEIRADLDELDRRLR